MKQITVLLVDDNPIVRESLCLLLEEDDHFVIAGQACNGREAVKMAQSLRPDVILMDIAMPVLNGLGATLLILAANPAAKVIVLSTHTDDAYVKSMIAAGAAGFLDKETCGEILPEAIREVADGHTYFSPAIVKGLHDGRIAV